MLQQLALLKGFDLDGLDPCRRRLHPSAGRMRQACLRRPRGVLRRSGFRRGADGDAVVRRLQRRARRKLVDRHRLAELRPGSIEGSWRAWSKLLRRAQTGGAAGAGEPTVGRLGRRRARGDTVHFDIVDQAGNMVSATPSGGWLQSSPVIPELGFCLGTRAQMFWLEEGHPASLAPGKRPRTTLTPTLALRDGEPYLAWGTPGGDAAGPMDHAVLPAPCPRRP